LLVYLPRGVTVATV